MTFEDWNEKINENYPLLGTLPEKSNYFQHPVKIIDIRQHPAGYPDPAFHLPDYPVSGKIILIWPDPSGYVEKNLRNSDWTLCLMQHPTTSFLYANATVSSAHRANYIIEVGQVDCVEISHIHINE